MWINHLGEIAIGLFAVLIAAHLGLHFFFKWQKRRKQRQNNPPQN